MTTGTLDAYTLHEPLGVKTPKRYRRFESCSLQERVHCELGFTPGMYYPGYQTPSRSQ